MRSSHSLSMYDYKKKRKRKRSTQLNDTESTLSCSVKAREPIVGKAKRMKFKSEYLCLEKHVIFCTLNFDESPVKILVCKIRVNGLTPNYWP